MARGAVEGTSCARHGDFANPTSRVTDTPNPLGGRRCRWSLVSISLLPSVVAEIRVKHARRASGTTRNDGSRMGIDGKATRVWRVSSSPATWSSSWMASRRAVSATGHGVGLARWLRLDFEVTLTEHRAAWRIRFRGGASATVEQAQRVDRTTARLLSSRRCLSGFTMWSGWSGRSPRSGRGSRRPMTEFEQRLTDHFSKLAEQERTGAASARQVGEYARGATTTVGRTCHDRDQQVRSAAEERQQNDRRLQRCYEGVERTVSMIHPEAEQKRRDGDRPDRVEGRIESLIQGRRQIDR